jgi:hypothetical protein
VSRIIHVHRNLNAGCWTETIRGYRIRRDSVVLEDVEFRVRPAGRRRARKDRRRNVHAYAAGAAARPALCVAGRRERVRYSPFHRLPKFYVTRGGVHKPVTTADYVVFDREGRAWAYGAK